MVRRNGSSADDLVRRPSFVRSRSTLKTRRRDVPARVIGFSRVPKIHRTSSGKKHATDAIETMVTTTNTTMGNARSARRRRLAAIAVASSALACRAVLAQSADPETVSAVKSNVIVNAASSAFAPGLAEANESFSNKRASKMALSWRKQSREASSRKDPRHSVSANGRSAAKSTRNRSERRMDASSDRALQDEDEEEEQNQDEEQEQNDNQEDEGDQEEENGQDEQEEAEEQQDEEEDADQNDAGDDEEADGEEEEGDDYYKFDDKFDDELNFQDDQYDDAIPVVDDFYAYQEDPGPPNLLPLSIRVIIGYFLASMALTLGASGGIGGGGIVVPVYILVMGLPLKVAVPCGAITVLGGAIGSTMLNWHRRHPLADRPLVDWDMCMLALPLILVGTILGTLFHRLLSEKFLLVLLVLLLSVTAHTTLTKAMRMYHAEKRYIRHLIAAQSEPPTGSPPRSNYTYTDEERNRKSIRKKKMDLQQLAAEDREQILILNPDYVTLRSDLMEQEKFTPRTKILALILMFSVVTFLNVMVGGGAYKSPWDIRCGSVAFWTVQVIMMAFLMASAWAAQTYVVARHELKELVRFDYVHGDVLWNAKSAVVYPLMFISAGLFAGTLGIGGGVITVPLMLHFGLHPAVASATSSAMILFTSFASSTSFVVFGLLLPDFGVVGFCIGFFAAITGQTIMRQARQATSASGRNFERNSYIAFVIGTVVLISALLMTMEYVLMIVAQPDQLQTGLCDGLRF